MATRRKYKTSPPGYRDGGAVMVDVVIPDAPEAPAAAPAPAPAPPVADDPLLAALTATRRAEEMQRQNAAQPQQQVSEHDRFVDSIPQLSERKRAFLRANPALVRQDIAELAGRHYQAALASGIADDSEEIEHYILTRTANEVARQREQAAHQRELTSARARPTEENHQASLASQDLQREAASFADEIIPPPEPAPAPTPLPARRSIPMSAPVSRNVPTMTGSRPQADNHLTAEERQIARNSFTGMSNEEKEKLYLANRRKLHAMRANGSYSD